MLTSRRNPAPLTAVLHTSTPLADAADAYVASGLGSPSPLPPGEKFPPLPGFTGGDGRDPSTELIAGWKTTHADWNIALRFADGVLAYDFDAYGGKPGAETRARVEAEVGPLPPTFTLTSRSDGRSLKAVYRLHEEDLALVRSGAERLPSFLAGPDDGVEILHRGHRYAMTWPSRNGDDDGAVVRWFDPEGRPIDRVPARDELTVLPREHARYLFDRATGPTRATAHDVAAFLAKLPDDDQDDDVRRIVDEFLGFLDAGRSARHEEMLRVTWELTVAGATGAHGVPSALAEAEAAFVSARVIDGGSHREATREWSRGLAGAVDHLGDYPRPLEPWDVDAEVRSAIEAVFTEARESKARRGLSYNPASTDDAHLGARIAEEYLRGRWCWSSGLGWLKWDRRRWEGVPETAAQEAIRRALIEAHRQDLAAANARLEARHDKARRAEDEEAAKAERDAATTEHRDRLRALRSYFTLGKIKAVLSIAKGVLIEDAESFDAEPYLLNVGNGVVDLRDGTLGPHRPELRFTKLSEVNYRPGATHADWDAALQAMPEDVREWMRFRFGQAATGFPSSDDVVPFLYGGGANGKTTVVTAILQALGDFAVVIPEKVLLTSPGDHPTEMMTLHGRRLTVLEELPQGRHLDAKRLKSIAGTDRITARLIGKDNVSWVPTHSLFVTTNYELRVDENDHGTWRRLVRVPFPHRFGEGPGDLPKDPNLRHRMREGRGGQHEAVLAWIVSGAADWYAAGEILPKAPPTVEESTREWRGTADVLGRFLDEVTELNDEAAVLTKEFYDVFRSWCSAYGLKPWGDQLLWERLKAHDVMTSGAVVKPGMARLGGRTFSSASGAAKPGGPARLLFGLRFTDEAKGYAAGAPFAG
jgi:putative DNA primase/helicase